MAFLHRTKEIGVAELAAIASKAAEWVAYNVGRSPRTIRRRITSSG